MASTTGLVIIKRFTYRDDPNEEWSNKYWLTGPPPNDEQSWTDLFNELASHEKTVYTLHTSIVAGIGYNDNTPGAHAVWVHDLRAAGSIPGTLTESTATNRFAGDQAAVVEWRVNRKNSRGKWIYLRKYFHDAYAPEDGDPDALFGGQRGAAGSFAVTLYSGGLNGHAIADKFGVVPTNVHGVSDWLTTRTLERRGKRPTPP